MRAIVFFSTILANSFYFFGQEDSSYVESPQVELEIENTDNRQAIDAMISFAKTFLGTPYRYAGSTPSGFDCSGFVNYVMKHFGLSLPRTSYNIAELGKTIRLAEVQPGDLLFFKGRNLNNPRVGHIAMVVDVNENEIKMIHASSSRGVVIDNFKNSKYYIPRFIKAKRMDHDYTSK